MSLEFIQPFDGRQPEISTAERQRVGQSFISFVDTIMQHNIDSIVTQIAGRDTLSLNLADKAIGIYIVDTPGHKQTLKSISVLKRNNMDDGNEICYKLGRDDIVRRYDLPGESPEQKQMAYDAGLHPTAMGSSKDEARLALENLSAFLKQDAENMALEEAMGVNNQPIGINELDSLIRLVESAEVIVP